MRPVLFLNTDQLRPDFLGCYGFGPATSPCIDRLAGESLRFDRAYTQSPVCTPARYSLLSGVYPSNHGALTCSHGPRPAARSLLPRFSDAGYRTVAVGKLHHNPPDAPFGFDSVHLHDGTFRDRRPYSFYSRFLEAAGIDEDCLAYPADMDDDPAKAALRDITHWGRCAVDEDHFETTVVARQALECIATWDHDATPFLYVGFLAPHSPYCPPAPWDTAFAPEDMPSAPRETEAQLARKNAMLQRERRPYTDAMIADIRAHYCGLIAQMDRWIGQLVESFTARFGEESLIVLTSDHGDFVGEHHRCEKNQMYEPATRVPLLLRAPGLVCPGATAALVEQIDVLPTLLGLLEQDETPWRIAGRDWSRDLRNGSLQGREWVAAEYHTDNYQVMVRTATHKIIAYQEKRESHPPQYELYDLAADPFELENLAGHPDLREAEAHMRDLLLSYHVQARRFDPPPDPGHANWRDTAAC